ncbi:thermonuclease family protein [Cupriavidus basilensis]
MFPRRHQEHRARALACATLTVLCLLPGLARAFPAQVVGVLDGDTVDVLSPEKIKTRCRLYGIDAPEKAQPFGQVSKQSLSDLIYRKTIDVQPLDQDRYGRTICRLRLDGLDVNREQLTRGMAWVYRHYTQEASYLAAEAQARKQRAGLWRDDNPTAPWLYRRQ